MSAWRHSLISSWSENGRDEWPCDIVIDDGRIVVSYKVPNGFDCYEGQETEPGHFQLRCVHTTGSATLHRFSGSRIVEGFWSEAGQKGMWRITLDDQPPEG